VKNLSDPKLQRFRLNDSRYELSDEMRAWGGAFRIPYAPPGELRRVPLLVIASRGGGPVELGGDEWHARWDHVSVSTPTRCPTWGEMSYIKELFFERDEPAMQLHPVKDYVNNHPYCLHLWRPLDAEIPLPPALLVGLPGLEFAA
jgi:hypothetical protein